MSKFKIKSLNPTLMILIAILNLKNNKHTIIIIYRGFSKTILLL
jgi:hypothetical protein